MKLTLKQAQYQARRVARVEFLDSMQHGNASEAQRFDSADYSARLAYDAKLKEWGFDPISDRQDFWFSQAGELIVEVTG